MKVFVFILTLIFSCSINAIAQVIKVACVGNSVTYGAGIENRDQNSYPAQLQKLLDENYLIENFGFSGATLLKNGHKPYWNQDVYKESQSFLPNIVIIHLGLNDQGNNNWPQHKTEFVSDYLELIKGYKKLPSKPEVIICKMTPTFSGHHWFEEGMRESFKEIQSQIEIIADSAQVQLIDLHQKLYLFPEYFPDNLHPTKEGAAILASQVYSAISGDYGGLQLPLLYGEKMVLQRNEPIVFNGIANSKEVIKICFNNQEKTTITSTNGKWQIAFPSMKAGGPYSLKFKSNLSEDITFNEVYIGEVWLASGQSNMDFKVKESEHAKTILKDSVNNQLFLYSLDPEVLKSGKFSTEELAKCNAKDYFRASGWSNNSQEIFKNFSAVAYTFAYNLQKQLNVPIGIVCNAVGGSPAQSWISRNSMEKDHQTIDLLNDTWLNPMTESWTANRKVENIIDKNKTGFRHPYDPTFLFDSGINPIKNYNFKGVIWYQGESNADQIELHNTLFKLLINDWRTEFMKADMPFYFVQLSSINRPNWGKFRNSQRRLLSIANTGMAVSSDVGHPTDVHPTQKWIIGQRLSKIALAKSYNIEMEFSGPMLDYINVLGNKLTVHLEHAEGLSTSNNLEVQDLEIAGANKIFKPAKSRINNEILEVWSPEVKNPRYIKYGYSPYTLGNLINKYGLPASTFSNLLEE